MRPFFKRTLAAVCLLTLFGQGCTKGPTAETVAASQRVTLDVWGVNDDIDVYNSILTDYRLAHPNVQINFRRLRLEEYEGELINALAEDRGPDIFLIHNDWVGKYQPKIVPMPKSTKTAVSVITGTIQKQQTWQMQTDPTITLKNFKDQYADVVAGDAIRNVDVSTNPDVKDFQDRVMGLPMSVDTLALYYNKDLLNAAGVPVPPENWSQFQEQVKKLVKLGPKGEITQAAAGIGTAYNVERAADILTALMIQNGAVMADENGYPVFNVIPPALSGLRDTAPGAQALEFYTDFANPAKEVFTWNASQPNSLDAFVTGKAAFFLGYAYQLPVIRARAPKLNLGIAKLPQIEGNPTKNYANYWLWAVSKRSKNQDVAWNLLNFMIKPEENKKYLDTAKVPAARKSQLADQANDESVGVFASQVLTAVSWYRGKDPAATENAILGMINDVVTGASNINDAMKFAVDKISQTF